MPLVYVFNASSQRMRLSINNPQQPGAQIPGVQTPSQGPPKPYTPFGIQIARSNDKTSSGTFINGQANSVAVQTQYLQSNPVSLNVPADSASTVDLWLYVFASVMILFDTKGKVIDQEPIDWGVNQMGKKSKPRSRLTY
jgi:hypothetical protein